LVEYSLRDKIWEEAWEWDWLCTPCKIPAKT